MTQDKNTHDGGPKTQMHIGIDRSDGRDFTAVSLRINNDVFVIPDPFARHIIPYLENTRPAQTNDEAIEALFLLKQNLVDISPDKSVMEQSEKAFETIRKALTRKQVDIEEDKTIETRKVY